MKNCANCGASISSWRKYCTHSCYSQAITGRKLSEEHKENMCGHKKAKINKETLQQLYLTELYDVKNIANKFSLSTTTIYELMEEYGIKRRKWISPKGDSHPAWKGGFHYDRGYKMIYLGNKKRKAEHIFIAEKALGRLLKDGEHVHHINEVRDDNRNKNLVICSNSYHAWLHAQITVGFLGRNKKKLPNKMEVA